MVDCPVCKMKVMSLKSNSHTIPKWMLKFARDSKTGRMVSVDFEAMEENIKAQDGEKDSIMCENCEENTARDDFYVARIINLPESNEYKSIDREIVKYSSNLIVDQWRKVDYEKLKRFSVGIVLKSLLFKINQNISVDSEFLQEVATEFLGNSDSFRLYMTKIPFYDGVVYPGAAVGCEKRWSFIGSGFKFVVYLRGCCDLDHVSEGHISLKKDGSILILHETIESAEWFTELRNKMIEIHQIKSK